MLPNQAPDRHSADQASRTVPKAYQQHEQHRASTASRSCPGQLNAFRAPYLHIDDSVAAPCRGDKLSRSRSREHCGIADHPGSFSPTSRYGRITPPRGIAPRFVAVLRVSRSPRPPAPTFLYSKHPPRRIQRVATTSAFGVCQARCRSPVHAQRKVWPDAWTGGIGPPASSLQERRFPAHGVRRVWWVNRRQLSWVNRSRIGIGSIA